MSAEKGKSRSDRKQQAKDTQERQNKQCSASSSADMAAIAVASACEVTQQQEEGDSMDAWNTGLLFLTHLIHATREHMHFIELGILKCPTIELSTSMLEATHPVRQRERSQHSTACLAAMEDSLYQHTAS